MTYVSGLNSEALSVFLKEKAQLAANEGTTLLYQIQVWALKGGLDDQQLNIYLATFPKNWKEKLPEWESTYKAVPKAISPYTTITSKDMQEVAPISKYPSIKLSEAQRAQVVINLQAEAAARNLTAEQCLYLHIKALGLPGWICDLLMGWEEGTTDNWAKTQTLKI